MDYDINTVPTLINHTTVSDGDVTCDLMYIMIGTEA